MNTLASERWGDHGPRLLLIHGSLNSAAAAFVEQQAFADEWTVIAPYRRGYRPSPHTDRIDPDRDAEEIVELIGSGAHLVGTSMGGVVAMRAAALVPDRVWSLTVIEPPALPNGIGHPAVDELREALMRHWERNVSADDETFLAGFLEALGVKLSLPSPLPPEFVEAVHNLKTERPWDTGVPLPLLAGTTFPKLVVSGGGTPAFEAVCDVLATHMNAERRLFPGSPHAVQRIGRPFNDALRAFLTAAESRRGNPE
ncbi:MULTISPECIES: alpha/beta fold hydrolase [unclassified Embleya]|uniref:alpha/beta fold hydrolase n=1 Tax=unclassified Embleya TaxID=2699296 RepID=UPI0036A8FC0D